MFINIAPDIAMKKTIVGFSHTHFSGTGHSDLGDFLIMPTVGKLKLNPELHKILKVDFVPDFLIRMKKQKPAIIK
jgi:hypothetical protein